MLDDEPPTPPPSQTDGTEADSTTDEDVLGEAGIRALNAERRARREAEARIKALEPLAARAQELEDATKTEAQRIAEELEAAKASSSQAEIAALRLTVALEKAPEGMPPARIAKLAERLRGADREALEADAEELFAEVAVAGPGPTPTRKPAADLKPGLVADGDGTVTLAEQIAAAEKAQDWAESRRLKSIQVHQQQQQNR